MKNGINTSASDTAQVERAKLMVNSRPEAFTIALFAVFIVGGIALYLARPISASESVTVHCERAAVIEAGEKRNFRKEKKLAFERCMDESLQTRNKPAS